MKNKIKHRAKVSGFIVKGGIKAGARTVPYYPAAAGIGAYQFWRFSKGPGTKTEAVKAGVVGGAMALIGMFLMNGASSLIYNKSFITGLIEDDNLKN